MLHILIFHGLSEHPLAGCQSYSAVSTTNSEAGAEGRTSDSPEIHTTSIENDNDILKDTVPVVREVVRMSSSEAGVY
jgi:hypothetical protein